MRGRDVGSAAAQRLNQIQKRTGLSALNNHLLRPWVSLIVNLQHMLHGKLGVALRCRQPLMAEQFLNRAQIGAFFQHVRAEGVAQGMRVDVR